MNRRYPNKIREMAVKLRRKGLTYQQISDKIGIPTTTICSWIKHEEKYDVLLMRARYRQKGSHEKNKSSH